MNLLAALIVMYLKLTQLVMDWHAVEGRIMLHFVTHWLHRVKVLLFEIHCAWRSLQASRVVATNLIKHRHVVL